MYKYTTLLCLATIGLWANLLFSLPGVVMCLIWIIFFTSSGTLLGNHFFGTSEKGAASIMGAFLILTGNAILLTGIYYLFSFSTLIATVVYSVSAIGILVLTSIKLQTPQALQKKIWSWQNTLFTVPAILLELALIGLIIYRRFDDTLISPWTLFGPRFFLVAGLVTVLTLATIFFKKTKGVGILVGIFFARILLVAVCIFAYGFGFDPFIHEAAMKWILAHGEIAPKTPYYIGAYMMILPTYVFTKLPFSFLHQAFVPILSAILIPTTFLVQKKSIRWLPFLALWPLSFFSQTTPNNLALLLALVASIFFFTSDRKKLPLFPIGTLLTGATCIHPFIGIPSIGIFITYILFEKKKQWLAYLSAILLVLITPGLLLVHGYTQGIPPQITSPFGSVGFFQTLLAPPYWWLWKNAEISWQFLYAYRFFLPYIFLIISLLFCRTKKHVYTILLITGALALSAVCLFSLTLPGVVAYERGAYAGRLLTLCLILFFPLFIEMCEDRFSSFLNRKSILMGVCILGALLLTVSWYFTYPTRDAISKYTGYAVRKADIDAVHLIAERNHGSTEYIVLTNQTVSSAALRELSFTTYHTGTDGAEHFLYSIPTGGPLYRWFGKMIYENQKREWMEEAMRFAGVKKAYFVHTNYWYPAAEIRDNAKKEAENFWDIDGRVWIYEYTLPTTTEAVAEVHGV